MEFEEEILPEPFSEKNIDGSPISGSAGGGSLFRSAPTQQSGVLSERRHSERRQGERRAAYAAPSGGEQNIYSAEAARIESQRAESMHHQTAGSIPSEYDMPAPAPDPTPAKDYAPEPVRQTDAYASETGYTVENSYKQEVHTPVHMEPVKKEEPRFEPPVDEKPGMIPNPMKMPPVKVKSSVDYDYDYDSDIGNDTDYDYDYDSDAGQTAEITASIRSTEDMPPEEDYYAETVTLEDIPHVSADGEDGDDDDDYGSADFGDDDDYGMDIDVDSDDDYR